MNKIFHLFCLLVVLSISIIVVAQSKADSPTKVVLGVVNGKAISLPQPEISPEIRKLRLIGSINVKVVIDESGNVISAQTATGIENPEMRKSCEDAAMLAKFTPTKLSGSPVKVTGIIVYNFVNEKSNEEKLKALGVATFLYLLRASATDLKTFNKFFESENTIAESIAEFSTFKAELAPLSSLEKIPLENRTKKVDEVIGSVKMRLNDPESWQFELGKNFVDVIHPFMTALISEGNFDPDKFNEAAVKENLLKIKNLIPTAPADFPKDVLQKLAALADFGNKTQILSPENFQDFQNKMGALLEAISPGSTK